MAGKRGARGWAALAIMLVSCVALGYQRGSGKAPGHGEAESDALLCGEYGCEGTMLPTEDGDYVCDTNSAHRRPAQQLPADQ